MDELKNFKEITKEELKLANKGIYLDEKRVFDLDNKSKEEEFRLQKSDSLKATKNEVETIANILETRDLNLSEDTIAKLEVRQGRDMSHILINSKKFTGDSVEMKDIKDHLLELERALTVRRDANTPITADEIRTIENHYKDTISSCQHYLNVKTTRTGNSRYAMVLNQMNNLCSELALITQMKELNDQGNEEYLMVECPRDLIVSAKLYNLVRDRRDFLADPDEDAEVLADGELTGAVNIPAEAMDKWDSHTQNIVKTLALMQKPNELVGAPGDDYCNITGALINILRQFPKGAHSVYLNSGTLGYKGKGFLRTYKNANGKNEKSNTLIGLTQSEDGRLTISIGDFSQELSFNRDAIIAGITGNILDNEETFGKELGNEVVNWIGLDAAKQDPATTRSICLKYVCNRTGIAATALHNFTTTDVRIMAEALRDGLAKPAEIKKIINELEGTEEEEKDKGKTKGKTKDKAKTKPKKLPITKKMINGQETLELLRFRNRNIDKLDEKVILKEQAKTKKNNNEADPDKPGPNGWTPNEMEVKALVADLIYSQDTWLHDETVKEPEIRIKNVIKSHGHAFSLIFKDDTILKSVLKKSPLPEDFTKPFFKEFDAIRRIALGDFTDDFASKDLSREQAEELTKQLIDNSKLIVQFKALELVIITATELGSRALQTQITEAVERMFGSSKKKEEKVSDETRANLLKNRKGLTNSEVDDIKKAGKKLLEDTLKDAVKGDKGQGLFIKKIFSRYFKSASNIDKRSMIASALRDCGATNIKFSEKITDKEKAKLAGNYLGGVFKGAGPLLQKTLQGMPQDSIPAELKQAFADVKSRLLPIPQEIVEAEFLSMVERSKGAVTKIEVTRALGAASVGQAFLCKMYGPSLPEEGKDVVVKILRPDVRNRMMREKKVMLACAKEVPGMEATYLGQLERIEEELDLTIEARNVERGKVYDKSRTKGQERDSVSSMKLNTLIAPTINSMVIEKSPGTTVDKYLEEIRERRSGSTDKYELLALLSQAKKRQKHLIRLAEKWTEEGLFGSGFYHGDLHAGNIMIDDDSATVIDFGNATQLDPKQLGTITKMMVAAAIGEYEAFLDGFHSLMKKDKESEAMFKKQSKQLKKEFQLYLSLDDERSTGQRIAVALIKAQELGLELPSAIFNFSQCQLRLQNTIAELNEEIGKIEKKYNETKGDGINQTSFDMALMVKNHVAIHYADKKADCSKLNSYYANGAASINSRATGYFIEDMLKADLEAREDFDASFNPESYKDELCDKMEEFVAKIRTKVKNGEAVNKLLEASKEAQEIRSYIDELKLHTLSGLNDMNAKMREQLQEKYAEENADKLIRLLADRNTTDEEIEKALEPYYISRSFPRALKILRKHQDANDLTAEKLSALAQSVAATQTRATKSKKDELEDVTDDFETKKLNDKIVVAERQVLRNNIIKDKNFIEQMAPYMTDLEYGEPDELTKAFLEIMTMRAALKADKTSVKKEDQENARAKFMYYRNKRMAKELNKMQASIDNIKVNANGKPGDFISVMADIITDNVKETIARLGFWAWKHSDELNALKRIKKKD